MQPLNCDLRGFTLIEVLIALVLIASVLTLGYGSVRNAALTTDRLYDRVLARWAAQNVATEIRVGARPSVAKAETYAAVIYGRPYRITLSTDEEAARARIVVTQAGATQQVLESLEVPL